jgi:hypothetical protein
MSSVSIIGVPANLQARGVPNTSMKHTAWENLLGFDMFRRIRGNSVRMLVGVSRFSEEAFEFRLSINSSRTVLQAHRIPCQTDLVGPSRVNLIKPNSSDIAQLPEKNIKTLSDVPVYCKLIYSTPHIHTHQLRASLSFRNSPQCSSCSRCSYVHNRDNKFWTEEQ